LWRGSQGSPCFREKNIEVGGLEKSHRAVKTVLQSLGGLGPFPFDERGSPPSSGTGSKRLKSEFEEKDLPAEHENPGKRRMVTLGKGARGGKEKGRELHKSRGGILP